MTLEQFELSVKNNLPKNYENLISENMCIGAAVSGGADSVSLLLSLCHILKESKINLKVITINHNIREYSETYGDCLYVQKLCENLKNQGFRVECEIVELKKGDVQKFAEERKNGTEEAARFLRYAAFEKFIEKNNCGFLCLAHNQNDQLETLLMRFLQGSSVDASGGIKNRGNFVRPLINIERSEIENYLTQQNVEWRTDSTNLDTAYLRNKIRRNLMPFLDEEFSGWKTAVLRGGKKSELDFQIVSSIIESLEKDIHCEKDFVWIDCENFEKQKDGIKYRILLKMGNLIGEENRIPFVFLQDFIKTFDCKKDFEKSFKNLIFGKEKDKVFIKKYIKSQTDLSFFAIIEDDGNYDFPFGKFSVKKTDSGCEIQLNDFSYKINGHFPFIIRNQETGDEIRCKDGNYKKVIDVFSDWKVDEKNREFIPLIQEISGKQEIKCIFGEFLGFYNWIVN